ncbi:hypothetical protein [Promicromonospora sp. NPDC060271]|uniref:hypothetical protein n=1 Tax=Promicromonospora sp. NPDC060271 TaxID=3347089 RepID=UPI00364FC594
MNEHERQADPAFDRLVAADPAKRAPDPVQGVLRAKVDALIAEQSGGARPGATQTEPAGHEQADELALRRYRRRTPWLVAAAVAGIVAAGGGGYVAGGSGAAPNQASEMAAERATDEAADGPSVMAGPDAGTDEATGQGEAESGTLESLDAGGDLPTATGLVFHAGAGLSDAPTTAEVRVAGTSGESLGTYPVISEVEAVERLGDPRFAGAVLGTTHQDPPPQEEARPSTAPAPGGPLAWPVEDVTIRSAALIEVRYALPDGTVLLVPAYALTDDEGNLWTVMAVDEELLDLGP